MLVALRGGLFVLCVTQWPLLDLIDTIVEALVVLEQGVFFLVTLTLTPTPTPTLTLTYPFFLANVFAALPRTLCRQKK